MFVPVNLFPHSTRLPTEPCPFSLPPTTLKPTICASSLTLAAFPQLRYTAEYLTSESREHYKTGIVKINCRPTPSSANPLRYGVVKRRIKLEGTQIDEVLKVGIFGDVDNGIAIGESFSRLDNQRAKRNPNGERSTTTE